MTAASSTWTHMLYRSPEGTSLCQGDVLTKTPEVLELLEEVHKHYLSGTYTHFQVVTQTCDLVRRSGGRLKARYITLAAVRPLQLAVERELEKHQDEFGLKGAMAPMDTRYRLRQFLASVVNNNHSAYFYLPAEGSVGMVDDSAAFLPLTIGIRAEEHYEKCLGARVLSLQEIFQAKLGSLLGNHYARVGTPDYIGKAITNSEWRKKAGGILDGICMWVKDEPYHAASRSVTADDLAKGRDWLRGLPATAGPATDSERVLDAVLRALNDIRLIEIAGADEEEVRKRIAAEPVFQSVLGRGAS